MSASPQRPVAALYAIFFLSGFCGLIYESIWTHYLKLLLGHAAYAQAVVLVVFVGGLALGAWGTGRLSERIRHPVLVYAAVEAVVGLMAFSFQRVFEAASAWATSSFLPAMCGEPGSCAASWVLAAVLILPASVLLGTTFPLMSAGVMRMGVAPGRGLSLLYFLNSAGAALGVLGSGFFLIPALGLPGTMLLAGSMNLLVALAAFVTYRAGSEASAAGEAREPAAAQADATQLRLLLLIAGLTGLSSFIYEVVWIRMLTLVFGAATHSFELMLAPFIFGLAVGAWWIRNRIEAAGEPLRLLGTIQVVMGVLAVATLPLYAGLFDAMAFVLRTVARTHDGYAVFNLVIGLMAAAVMLPATFCAGMTLPLITAILLKRGHGERQVGQVYGINTFGAIAGVLLTVHLLIPALGLKWSLAFGAAIDVVLGLALWRLAAKRATHAAPASTSATAPGRLAWGLGAAALASLLVVPLATQLGAERLASGVFRHGKSRIDASMGEVKYHQDGKTATVTLAADKRGVIGLFTNGKSDGATHPHKKVTTPDDHTMILTGVLGPAHHPRAKRVAVVGIGTGTSSAVLLESQHVEVVDTIEIEPLMVEAARAFRPRVDKVYTDPRSRIIIDDARAHFSKTGERYDLIVSEPSNPWVSGVANLFTVEFYRHISAHLAPDGHVVQWLQLYEASPEVAGSILRAFAQVFPEFTAYATNHADVVLVARNDRKPPVLDIAGLDAMPGVRDQLLELGIDSAAMLAAHNVGPASFIGTLARSYGAPPNSDFFPYVDHHAASARFRREEAKPLFALRYAPVPILEFAAGPAPFAGLVTHSNERMPPHLHRYAAAYHGLRYLQGQPLDESQMRGLAGALPHFALARTWAAGCSYPAPGPELDSLVQVASAINPGLAPAQAGGYWRGALAKCGKSLRPLQAAWLELFAAVGERNAETTFARARQVLAEDAGISSEARAYATLAGVSAGLAIGRRQEAAQLVVTHRPRLTEEQMEQPWFRYLVVLLSAP
jgi:spermidine synthase